MNKGIPWEMLPGGFGWITFNRKEHVKGRVGCDGKTVRVGARDHGAYKVCVLGRRVGRLPDGSAIYEIKRTYKTGEA